MLKKSLFAMAAIVLIANLVNAQVPQLINYQALLLDPETGLPVPDGTYTIIFSIYDVASGGSPIWTESQSVSTKDGMYNVLLGSSSSLTSNILSGPKKYLGIKVGTDQEMTPRKRIVSVAYSILSDDADKVDGKHASAFADSVHSHDDRYYTETELNTSDGDPPNQGSNRLSWDNLKDVPEGFADGVDDTSNVVGGNTLDQAYDQGGAGAGRTITADAGAVNIEGADGLTVNGNVGIGTTNPTEKLQVAGTIHTTLNGFKFPDGTVQTTAATGTGDITAVTAGNGLAGGGESGDVTLDVSVGTGITVLADSVALNTTYTDGRYVNEEQANSIANLMIANDAVTSDKIAADAVGSSEVADNSLTVADLADNSVDTSEVKNNSLTATDLAVDVVSRVDGVTNDGGNIDLVAGDNITITSDDVNNQITISASGGQGNTLDQAYDQGGAGAGRSITADAGEVHIGGADGLVVEGNVGIGLEPPAEMLHVAGNIKTEENLYAPNGVGMFRGLELSQYAVVDGNVGIGTMSPISSLDIQLSGEMDALTVRASSGSGRADLYQQGPDNSIAFELDDPTSGASKIFLSPTMSSFFNGGNVGIGTMSPDAKLTIEGSSNGLALAKINQTGNRNFIGLRFDRNNDEKWFIGMNATDDNLIFRRKASSNDVVIYGDGNVLIGTPEFLTYAKLHAEVPVDSVHGTSLGVFGKAQAGSYGTGGRFEGGDVGVEGRVVGGTLNQCYFAVFGEAGGGGGSGDYTGVLGSSIANSDYNTGVYGEGNGGTESYGVAGLAWNATKNYGVYGSASYGTENWAGYFRGDVNVTDSLTVGSGSFNIDHPLDPENKYLSHSFVESPDMMNVYNGNVILSANGEAWVELPQWFESLNKEFRYQLTCIGGFAQIYIAEEINNNRFKIAGGTPGLKVSWQVTGIRNDPYAEKNRIQVEQMKPADERGKYLHPQAYGLPENMGIDYERRQRMEERRQRMKEKR